MRVAAIVAVLVLVPSLSDAAVPPQAAPPAISSDAEACTTMSHVFKTSDLDQWTLVHANADCAAKRLEVRLTFVGQQPPSEDGASALQFAYMLCTREPTGPNVRSGWRLGLTIDGKGRTPKSATVDCAHLDQLPFLKHPPPAGTPEALAQGIRPPAEPASRPVLDTRIGEDYAETMRRSTLPLPQFSYPPIAIFDKMDLLIRHGDATLRFERIGGGKWGGRVELYLSSYVPGPTAREVQGVTFVDQDRPLKLAEVIERAKALEGSFAASGFGACVSRDQLGKFAVTDTGGTSVKRAADWETAQALLADDVADVRAMRLFSLCAPDVTLEVLAIDARRTDRDAFVAAVGPPDPRYPEFDQRNPAVGLTAYDGNGGYEWILAVLLHEVHQRPD
jgi:hypothetical protein